MAVIVENGGYGGAYAAPIASFITEQYLTNTVSNRTINGSSLQKYKDANLLPVLKNKKPKKITSNKDSLQNDSLKNSSTESNDSLKSKLNKTAIKPKNNATAKQ